MKFIIVFFILLTAVCFSCQTSTKIYMVRHAEKDTEPVNNPHLTSAGLKRAEALRELLKEKNITHIFSTNTNRTTETALPLSKAIGIEIKYYGTDTLDRFLQHITSLKSNSLVIGHSNTLLPMLDKMNLQHNLKTIGDLDYDNLFIITVKNGKALKVKETTYGSR